jgi:outer membrane protein assembly factor BamA
MQFFAKLRFENAGRALVLAIVFISLLLPSCKITKNVPDNEYLLDNTSVELLNKDKKLGVKQSELEGFVRQKPNKRVLLFRFHLRMYNFARPNKDNAFSRLFRKIGEEPVILDTFQTLQTVNNLERYLVSKGFYDAKVLHSTETDKKRAKVNYTVEPGLPFRIRNINYVIEDTLIRQVVLNDTVNKVLRKGTRFDMDLLREERKRIESVLKEEGYFFFSRDFINFEADTAVGNKRVDLDLTIRNRFTRNQFGDRIPEKYRKFEISNVYIYTNYDPVEFFLLEEANLLDTTLYNNQNFIYSYSPGIRYKAVSNSNLIRPGQMYSESVVQKTRNNLNALRLYRAVNIFFRPDDSAINDSIDDANFLFFNKDDEQSDTKTGKLNCYIQLTPHTLQSYQVDLVGTNTASDIGVEGNLSYQHKNIFRGAEIFDTKFRGMMQFISTEQGLKNSVELGGSVGLNFPRFVSPFAGQEHIKWNNPRTQIATSYNYQNRPDYTRTVAGLSLAYSWRSESRFSHVLTPVEVNLINILNPTQEFLDRIRDTYLENSYKNYLVTLTNYSITYNTQSAKKGSFTVVRYNVEVSGNLLNSAYSLWGQKAEDNTYQLFNTSFSQYVRSDVNIVFNHYIDDNNTFVYRIFAGAGLPYGNSNALPFEKKYFSGGSTGVRAWHARGLGPGSYVEFGSVPNQTADIKLEANVEYRFRLFWMLQGALFFDAGNIWAITSADDRPGAVFFPNQFYKQIALGTGTGIRMNLGFFILRFDLGIKVYDPGIHVPPADNPTLVIPNYHWIPFDRKYVRNDFTFHFGIGYPF